MTYAQAVTLIDELPQMIQLPPAQKTVNMDPRFINDYDSGVGYGSRYPDKRYPVMQESVYYEEIVKDYPNIQSKIRKTDPNPYGKYDETMEPKVIYHQENDIYTEIQKPRNPYSRRESPTQQNYPEYPDYPEEQRPKPTKFSKKPVQDKKYKLKEPTRIVYNNKFSAPGSIENDYMSGDMIPEQEEQHLAVSSKQRAHYDKPMMSNGETYPIVEHYSIQCTDVMDHINKCPVCYKLYKRNEMFYLGLIVFLFLIVLFLLWKNRK